MSRSSKFGSPHSLPLGLDVEVVAERLAELAHSSPFTVAGGSGNGDFVIDKSLGGDKKSCSPVVDPLDAAHVVQELFRALHVMAAESGICLQSCVRSRLRQMALEAEGPAPHIEQRDDGEAPGGASTAAEHVQLVSTASPVSASRLRRKSQQPQHQSDEQEAASDGRPVDLLNAGGSSLLVQSTTTSSTNPIVDEFFDRMVLPSVAREALRSSAHLAEGEGTAPSLLRVPASELAPVATAAAASKPLPQQRISVDHDDFVVTQPFVHSEPEVDSPLLHQLGNKPGWGAPAEEKGAAQPVSARANEQEVAAASTDSTMGGSNNNKEKKDSSVTGNRRSDSEKNVAVRWMKRPAPRLQTPLLQPASAQRVPQQGSGILYGLLLLDRVAKEK